MPRINDSKYLVMCGWDHVPHLDERTKAELLASTPTYLRDARSKGIPTMGNGRIFTLDEAEIRCDAFPIPPHWPRIAGMDIGWDHPTTGVWLAWDRDNDVIYLTETYKRSEATIETHASAFKRRGGWIPVAWPHDGLQHDKHAGIAIAQLYRDEGVNMLLEMATFPDQHHINGQGIASRTSVEAGIMEMQLRMQQGRWKVFKHCEDWFEEYRLYHRQEGKIVKLRDDLISASRYAMMMVRFAITEPARSSFRKERVERRADWRVL